VVRVERVIMPQLGETVTEGTIIRWLKEVGDVVALDDGLFEVSTDKVDAEVPSAYSGVLRRILVPEGETVPVGTVLAVITETADEELAEAAPAIVPAAPRATATWEPSPPAGPRSAATPSGVAPPTARRTPAPLSEGNGFLSPVVKALLAEHGLSPAEVEGTGRDGRITRADVLATAAAHRAGLARSGASTTPPTVAPASDHWPATIGTQPYPPAEPSGDDEIVEFTRARRTTGEHMLRSLATSAHTLVATEVDYSGVESVRAAARLSYLPFVARAVVDAIGEFPNVNASVGRDELIVHRHVHLGVAVDVDFQALVVPVVANAENMRLPALAAAVAEVAAKARAKRLSGDDLSGGTFTITNVGSYGTLVTAPVINQPQVAIVSTDGVRMRPVALKAESGEWTIGVHPVGNLCLSFDHRAFDGAYASAFLARVRDILEHRDWTQEV
jgi:2-oxoglutarate dehydrogenase E2 component (dihydrolipoamide succinyltransferase)